MRPARQSGLRGAAICLALTVLCPQAPAQIIRTAPDLDDRGRRAQSSGPVIDRNGIRTNSSNRRTTHYVLPSGGYYYGWYPSGGYGYYGGDYYYSDRYLCPYCGRRWCDGSCRYPGPIVYPPVVGDAGAIYGPRSVREFLGVDGGNNNSGSASEPNPLRTARVPAPAVPKISNPTARATAWKFVEYGDKQFKQGDYRDAADRYRKAESQAPEIADIHFRLGFAQMGAGRYAEGVAAMREGLRLKPNWPDSGFVLEELYPTPEAKRNVFRQLHSHLNENPTDADAQFLLAVMQHFDGQAEAAELGFRRVVQLNGRARHAMAFLPLEPPADADAGQPGDLPVPERPQPLEPQPLEAQPQDGPLLPPQDPQP